MQLYWTTYVFSEKDKILIENVIEKTCSGRNKIFRKIDKNYYVSKNNLFTNFNVKKVDIVFDERWTKILVDTVFRSFWKAPLYKTSLESKGNDFTIKFKNKIYQIVGSICHKFFYCKNDVDVLDFASEWLFKFTTGHCFTDGNKRTAIISTSDILNIFGYHISWSKDNKQYLLFWESFLEKVAAYKQFNLSFDEVIMEIRIKLMEKLWVDASRIK